MIMCVSVILAQGVRKKHHVVRHALPDTSFVVAYMDSLLTYKVRLDSSSDSKISNLLSPVANADAFRMFSPVVYYGSAPSTIIRGASERDSYTVEMLDKAIYTSLRRVDVSTRYSSRQTIVVLMDANAENGELVAKRILGCFEKLYIGRKLKVEYDIAEMEAGIILRRNAQVTAE